MDIKILYEDKDILAIDKPSGISVHPDGKTKEETISDWFVKKYPNSSDVGEPMGDIMRPGIVHRLDKGTSGVLLLAKTKSGHEHLKKQFQDHSIKKIYHTVTQGNFKDSFGKVDKPIGRSPSDHRRRLAGRGARGEMREALTRYKVLKNFEENGHKFSYLEVIPKTGRTHQIRVHMKFLQHPLAGDELYNPGKPMPEGFDRLALHARSIEFENTQGERVLASSPLPVAFEKILC